MFDNFFQTDLPLDQLSVDFLSRTISVMDLIERYKYGCNESIEQIEYVLPQMEAYFGLELSFFLSTSCYLFFKMICECF